MSRGAYKIIIKFDQPKPHRIRPHVYKNHSNGTRCGHERIELWCKHCITHATLNEMWKRSA